MTDASDSARAERAPSAAPARTPARAGVLVYALELGPMSGFYQRVLGAAVRHADETHEVLQTGDTQLLLHRIPEPARAGIERTSPPAPRSDQAIKPFFTVPDLEQAERAAVAAGGLVLGETYTLPMMRVRNVCDPEGNILHLRELTA